MVKRTFQFILAVAVVSLAMWRSPATPAHASTLTVTTLADTLSAGSLRYALMNAGSGDTINFSVTGSLPLSLGELLVPTDVIVQGPGSGLLTVDAGGNSRVLDITASNVSISGLTLTNGSVTDGTHISYVSGAGILANGSQQLTLDDVHVTNSTLTCSGACDAGNGMDGQGGGISFSGAGALTITNSTISGNSAPWSGGGIYFSADTAAGHTLTITNSTIENNSQTDASAGGGGGISYNQAYAVKLTEVNVSGNTARLGGGVSTGTGTITVERSTFDSNQAQMDNFIGGGGGIYLGSNSAGVLVSNSTFSGNTSVGGGGGIFDNAATLVAYNSTFTGNSVTGASMRGGAISAANSSTLLLQNDTIAGNGATSGGGGGLFLQSGTDYLENTIVSNSLAGASDCSADSGLTSWAYMSSSLIETNDAGNPCPSVAYDSDPMLAPLADNGGPTKTMALQFGSPAIDAGSPAVCSNASTVNNEDQRGHLRPVDGDGSGSSICDIGAFEFDIPVVNVKVASSVQGTYPISEPQAEQYNYAGVNGGPAVVTNTSGGPLISSIRVLYGGSSYSEMMGFPNKTTGEFWFPWYNDVAFDSQFRVSNLGTTTTTVTVYLHNAQIDSFNLAAGAAVRKNYAGRNGGPMYVFSSGGVPILSTIRVLYGGSSYSEMMGFPDNTTKDFWFPWYNDVAMDSQFRVSNLGNTSTTITVYLHGSQIDQFTLAAGAAVRKNYAGHNGGPMHVNSSAAPILSTIRVLYGGNSYSEMMGFPNDTTTDFWFPWYDDVAADSQFRVSNLGATSTTITVTLDGTQIDSFGLAAGGAVRKNYSGKNNGSLHIASSGEPILPTVRVLYGGTSFYEVMGYPGNALTSTQYFPWYNDVAFDSQMRIGVP